MDLLYADEYIECLRCGKPPDIVVAVGGIPVTNGMLINGKYLLEISGEWYEVKPMFELAAFWSEPNE